MQSDVIRRRIKFVQADAANSEFLGYGDGNKRIMRDDFHCKRSRPSRYFHSNAAKSGNSQRLAAQFRTLQRLFLPLAGMHQRIRTAKMTSHGQHHAHCLFRDCYGIRSRRIHHRDALTRGCVQIDIVDAHAGTADHAQFLGMRQQRSIGLHRGAHDERVGRFQLRCEFAVYLVRR